MAKWLAKVDNQVLSFCECEHALASVPGQLDCPWCGCGYLLTCSYCRKAFTFATVVEMDARYEDLIAADRARGGYAANPDLEREHAELMAEMLGPFAPGATVVYLDGVYLRADDSRISFDGLFARHELARTPQAVALAGGETLAQSVGRPEYWLDREHDDRSE